VKNQAQFISDLPENIAAMSAAGQPRTNYKTLQHSVFPSSYYDIPGASKIP